MNETRNPQESHEARLKRMHMRAWRRGTKEMDLVLGPWADVHLADLSVKELEIFDSILAENDQDLMQWVLEQKPAPEGISGLLAQIATYARIRLWKTPSGP
jgi:antitoxin CptB